MKAREHGFYLVSAGAFERHDHDYLRKLLPADGSVHFQPVTTQLGRVWFWPARTRARCCRSSPTPISPTPPSPGFRASRSRSDHVGLHALRVNFVGELGWEFHHPIEQQVALFDQLMEAGKEFGIRPYGIKAMLSLSIEKSYRLVPRELSIEYSASRIRARPLRPSQQGRVHRPRCTGARGREKGSQASSPWKSMASTDVDARGSEPILQDGKLIGRATNGGYGWRVNKSLALGMVRPDLGEIGTELEITILGKPHRAVVVEESPFDTANARLRA